MFQQQIANYEAFLCFVEDDRCKGHVHGLEQQEGSESLPMPLQQGLCSTGKAAISATSGQKVAAYC